MFSENRTDWISIHCCDSKFTTQELIYGMPSSVMQANSDIIHFKVSDENIFVMKSFCEN